jgi:hypothetical protein
MTWCLGKFHNFDENLGYTNSKINLNALRPEQTEGLVFEGSRFEEAKIEAVNSFHRNKPISHLHRDY